MQTKPSISRFGLRNVNCSGSLNPTVLRPRQKSMSLKAWRIIRTILHYAFYACCVLVVLFPILVFGSLLMNPFTGFAGSSAFADKPGAAAKRLLNEWPTGVVPSSVKLVSRKYDYSIDSHSSWYKIELDSNSAQIWADAVHVDRERDSLQCLRQDDRGLEAVRRIVPGPPPQIE